MGRKGSESGVGKPRAPARGTSPGDQPGAPAGACSAQHHGQRQDRCAGARGPGGLKGWAAGCVGPPGCTSHWPALSAPGGPCPPRKVCGSYFHEGSRPVPASCLSVPSSEGRREEVVNVGGLTLNPGLSGEGGVPTRTGAWLCSSGCAPPPASPLARRPHPAGGRGVCGGAWLPGCLWPLMTQAQALLLGCQPCGRGPADGPAAGWWAEPGRSRTSGGLPWGGPGRWRGDGCAQLLSWLPLSAASSPACPRGPVRASVLRCWGAWLACCLTWSKLL